MTSDEIQAMKAGDRVEVRSAWYDYRWVPATFLGERSVIVGDWLCRIDGYPYIGARKCSGHWPEDIRLLLQETTNDC